MFRALLTLLLLCSSLRALNFTVGSYSNYYSDYPSRAGWGPYAEARIKASADVTMRSRFTRAQNYVVFDGSESITYLENNELELGALYNISRKATVSFDLRGGMGSSNTRLLAASTGLEYFFANDIMLFTYINATRETYEVNELAIENDYIIGTLGFAPMLSRNLELILKSDVNTSKYSTSSTNENAVYLTLGANYYQTNWLYYGLEIRGASDLGDYRAMGGGANAGLLLWSRLRLTLNYQYLFNREVSTIDGVSTSESFNSHMAFADLSLSF